MFLATEVIRTLQKLDCIVLSYNAWIVCLDETSKTKRIYVCLAGHHVYMNNTPIVISVRGVISSMDALLFRIEKNQTPKLFLSFVSGAV